MRDLLNSSAECTIWRQTYPLASLALASIPFWVLGYHPMYSCPGEAPKSQYQAVRNTLEVISGKWKLFLLAALLTRPFRFRELSREVALRRGYWPRSCRSWSSTSSSVAPSATRALSRSSMPHSRTLLPVVQALSEWGYLHYEVIERRICCLSAAARRACRPHLVEPPHPHRYTGLLRL